MRSYLAGVLIAGLAAIATNVRVAYAFPYLIESAYTFVAVPLIAAWGTAAVCHRLRPPRLLAANRQGWLRPFVTGAFTGCVVLAGAGYVAYATPVALPTDLIMAGLTVPCVWLSLIERTSKYRGFLCKACQYDLRGSMEFGRCPECGLEFDSPSSIHQVAPVA